MKGQTMQHRLNLDDDTAELYEQLSHLTDLTPGELINRQLSAHHAEGHELLALVSTHPELREQAANLLQSYGPEPMLVGIKRIAPPYYLTLSERFEREMSEVMDVPNTAS
jgi:hypothetical protein